MEIKVESPEYIDPSLITWSVSKWEIGNDEDYWETVATIDQNGVVTAIKNTYNNLETKKSYDPIYVTCSIYGGQTVIKHELRIVVPQPKKIVISGKGDNENSHTVKIGSEYSLASTIYPDAVQSSGYFDIIYQSSYEAVASVDFNSGLVSAKAPGTARMTITAKSDNTGRYAYPSGTEWKRYFDIIVEPYWVETLTLPETMTLAPDATATLTPVFTSDVNGKQPTNQTLTWTSSDPSIVSINETTGEMKALAEGTVQITATTASGAAANSAIKTATCIITVKTPVAEVKVGDYYYSDGTWGSDPQPTGKSVIGVIFSKANAVASDAKLREAYPLCSNGLVVSTKEYERAFGEYAYSDANAYGIALHLDGSILSRDIPNGYGLTEAYGKYRNTYINDSSRQYCEMFDVNTGLPATHSNAVASPSKASSWYIPSYFEMTEMYTNKKDVNAALSAINGDELENKNYIHATLWTTRWDGRSYDDCSSKYFDMSNGGWGGTYTKTTAYPVRVVLAF